MKWIAVVLGCALVAAAIVVYALVRITAPGGDDDEAMATSTASESDTLLVSSPTTMTTLPSTGASSSAAEETSTAPTTLATHESSSGAGMVSSAPTVPASPTSSPLTGSGVVIPASWSGSAKVTVTVLGQCATGSPSVYTDLPADLALDLVQNEANAAATGTESQASGNGVMLSLGVNTSGVPSLALYSSGIDDAGTLHRYWQLRLRPDGTRTMITGTLVNEDSTEGSNPNLMVDAETSLQPCEAEGTVSLPRVLADGSSLTGWVGPARAELRVHATTTDGKRSATIEVKAVRNTTQ